MSHHEPPREGEAPSTHESPEGHPRQIGPYRILDVLAEGGMGLVYVAEQQAPIRRLVALKVIRAGLDMQNVIARFEAERQALAVMDHPNIAKVFDGGVTDEGMPYFVMELVKGIPIDEYCDQNKVSTHDRLLLFIDVCDAVQHAHQKGVIHRDLKPSNVLVMLQGTRPVVKVIDFGIAKALSQPLTEDVMLTQAGIAIGTPAYMSPEQAAPSALDVDTRTDVYSLGVMLYELLVGRLPLDPTEIGFPLFMVRLAERSTNVSRPSAKLNTLGDKAATISSNRRTDLRGLQRELRGDVDWIVMKAIDPDRARRYETVSGFAMDLQRFLRHEAVEARPPSALYRLQKFARRNRVAVAAGALVAVAIIAGGSVAGIGLVRARRAEAAARREAETARQVASFLTGIFEVSDPGEARGNSITAREILDRGAERIRTELAGQPLVQAQMMLTIGGVYRELGLFASAQPLLDESLAIRRKALGEDDAQLQASVWESGRLAQQQGRFAVAESLYRETLRSRERTLGVDAPALSVVLSSLGGLFVTRGRYAEAESLLTRAVALRERSGAPDDIAFALLLGNQASAYLAQGRFAESEPVFRRALSMYERTVGADHPDVGRTLSNLGVVYYFLKRYEEAEQYYLRAEANLTKTLGADHPNIASININLGEIAWLRRDYPQAERRLLRALAILQARVDPGHPSVATAEYDLANVLRDSGRGREAEVRYLKALQIRERALGSESAGVAEVAAEYAKLLRQQGRDREAALMEARGRAITK